MAGVLSLLSGSIASDAATAAAVDHQCRDPDRRQTMSRIEVRWLAACGLLLGAGLGLMWAGGKISVDRLLDALDDAMTWEDDEVLGLA